VLDLGCSGGLLSERVRALGHRVTAVDVLEIPGIRDRVDHFVQADLDHGVPAEVVDAGPFEIVLAADVLEHVREPERLLEEVRALLVPGGVLVTSVPNFGHWYARGRVALGIFDYDQRGILDRGHVRFFTRRGLLQRLRGAGFTVVRQASTGLPLDVLAGGAGKLQRVLRTLDRVAVAARPTLFGYQFVCMCESALPSRSTVEPPLS
jgi:SAM-dependent methyltransferase